MTVPIYGLDDFADIFNQFAKFSLGRVQTLNLPCAEPNSNIGRPKLTKVRQFFHA